MAMQVNVVPRERTNYYGTFKRHPEKVDHYVCNVFEKVDGHRPHNAVLLGIVFTGARENTLIHELRFGDRTIISEGNFPALFFDIGAQIDQELGQFQGPGRPFLRSVLMLAEDKPKLVMRVTGPFVTAAAYGLIALDVD